MYVHRKHRLTDREALFGLMTAHPLGAWVCHGRDGLIANHVPAADRRSRGRPVPWSVDDAPAAYIDQLMLGIVGIEMPIDRLEGKLKASQDEAMQDRLGTVQGLQRAAGAEAAAMADLVHKAAEAEQA